MKTHSIFKDKSLIKEKVPTSELFTFIPAGARLTKGNTVRRVKDPSTGKDVEVHETKASYKCREGYHIHIIEEKN